MLIRPYQKADREACIAIFKGNMPRYFDAIELPGFEQWLAACGEGRLAYPTNVAEKYFVAEQEGRTVACGGYCILPEGTAHVAWGMVENACHRRGIGRAFLEYRLNDIKTHFPHCRITLVTSQHTYAFYEKMGFRVVAVTEDAFAPGLHKYEMVC